MKTTTSWTTLMTLAKALGEARKSGDPERIADAEARHRAYEEQCLQADGMLLPVTVGELS